MNNNSGLMVYHSLNLPIEEIRAYNIEKYHFLSCILDILIIHLQAEKRYSLNQEKIFEHFRIQNLKIKKEKEKFNAAIAQLVSSGMIKIDMEGIISLTNDGIKAYNNQLFHSIAANLYSAERSDHLSKIAIAAATILTLISICCTIISICCSQ